MKFWKYYSLALTSIGVLVVGYYFVGPLLDFEGVISEGEHRGLYVGQSRVDVEVTIRNGFGDSRLKLMDIRQ